MQDNSIESLKGGAGAMASPQRRPLVSVGMPVYNGEKFIRQALDSLLGQSFSNFELIISDNASTDGTEAICREFASADVRIRYLRQPKNFGAVNNFKFVLDEAVGEYFMWAAADDYWDSKWIETLVVTAKRHQCLSYGLVQAVDEKGNEFAHPANRRVFSYVGNRFARRCKYFLEPNCLGKANPIYGIFPKYLLGKDGLEAFEFEKYGGDMVLLYVLLGRCEIRNAGDVFLYKRDHLGAAGGSVASRQHVRRGMVDYLKSFVNAAFFDPLLHRYVRKSSSLEAICLCFLYPIAGTLSATYTVLNKIRRMSAVLER